MEENCLEKEITYRAKVQIDDSQEYKKGASENSFKIGFLPDIPGIVQQQLLQNISGNWGKTTPTLSILAGHFGKSSTIYTWSI